MKTHSDSKITKDTPFQGHACNGFLMIFISILLIAQYVHSDRSAVVSVFLRCGRDGLLISLPVKLDYPFVIHCFPPRFPACPFTYIYYF